MLSLLLAFDKTCTELGLIPQSGHYNYIFFERWRHNSPTHITIYFLQDHVTLIDDKALIQSSFSGDIFPYSYVSYYIFTISDSINN